VDGAQRVVGFRKVDGTELVALASVGMGEVLSRFWRNVSIFLALVVPALLALTGAAIWIIRLLQRDAHRQADLAAALATNTMLFREIHHRVKNNLQSMHALVRMQNLPADTKIDLQSRFVAMAAVHEHMYQYDAYAQLDAPTFIASVAEPVVQAYGSQVALELDVDPIAISHDQATPLALLINEVMTNALKYAFADRTDGTIRLELKAQVEGGAMLLIADNGSGFDHENIQAGMGSRLVKGVVAQLNGTYSYRHAGGTVFCAELGLISPTEHALKHA
jgi:two-component sensor histidine kinase